MFPTNRGICLSLKDNSNGLKTLDSGTVLAQWKAAGSSPVAAVTSTPAAFPQKGSIRFVAEQSLVQIRPTQPRINAKFSGHSNPRRRSLTLIPIDFATEQSVPVGGEDQDGVFRIR